MATNKEKHINQIVGNTMTASSLEKPSPNFTNSVLSKIEALETSKFKYEPVISQRIWLAIAAFSIVGLALIVVVNPQSQSSYLGSFNNIFQYQMDWSFMPSLSLEYSKIFFYAILIFGLMFAIQISYLKYYFRRRF